MTGVEVLRLAPGSSTAAAARLEAAHVRIDDLMAWAEVCRARGEHAIGAAVANAAGANAAAATTAAATTAAATAAAANTAAANTKHVPARV
jgi:hypothetical protein